MNLMITFIQKKGEKAVDSQKKSFL